MRQRINSRALCSSDNYSASRKAHHWMLQEAHEAFLKECECFMIASIPSEPSDDTLVYVTMFGIKKKMPYRAVKAANLKWSWT